MFTTSAHVNFISAYVAAQETVKGWKSLSGSEDKLTFIYTGNCGNVVPLPSLMDLSVGKAASAGLIATAAESYRAQQYRYAYHIR